MFSVEDEAGNLITCCDHFEVALSLLRRIPRAWKVYACDPRVELAYKPGGDLVPLAIMGRDAGTPVMHKALAS